MAVKPIPDGYHTLTPFIVVEGAAGLIDFVLGRMRGPGHTGYEFPLKF